MSSNKPSIQLCAARGAIQVGAPFHWLALDYLGPFPVTPRGNQYIPDVINLFSKWVEIFPLHDESTTRCAAALLNKVVSRFGTPLRIHSDQGHNFLEFGVPRAMSAIKN